MIYLFNSASQGTYFRNVYCIVGLPNYCHIEMRYSPDNAPDLSTDMSVNDDFCVICYVDRYSTGGYTYYPMRAGRIQSIERVNNRVYYLIELQNHCHCEDPRSFTRRLEFAAPEAPRLTNGDPDNKNDGIYCVPGPELAEHLSQSEKSWATVLDQLYSTKAFSGDVPSFFLARVQQDSPFAPQGDSHGLSLHANKNYRLDLYYKYPSKRVPNGRKSLTVSKGTEWACELPVESAEDRATIELKLSPLDFSPGQIAIRSAIDQRGSGIDEIAYTAIIKFQTQAWRTNIALLTLLFLVCFGSALFDTGLDVGIAKVAGSASLEFLKFVVILWAIFKYRGQIKLPGL